MKNIIIGLLVFSIQLFAITFTEDTVLTQDEVYTDVNVTGCILNLNGHTLTVNGNFSTNGENARLQMKKSDDKLIVKGDVTFGGASTYEDLSKGILELTGDFYQIGLRSHQNYKDDENTRYEDRFEADNAYSFYPTGEHKVVFNGTSKQTVIFEAPDISRFMNVEILNSSSEGVVFEHFNAVGHLTRNANNISMSYIANWTLTEDYTVSNAIAVHEIINLNGHTLTVNGNFSTNGENARLQMKKSDDKLIVKGDVTFGGASTYEDLSKGILELTGDFYQIGLRSHQNYKDDENTRYEDRFEADNAYSFYPTGEHKVVFNGTSKQTVIFEAASYSRFNDLQIQNSAGVVFKQVTNAIGTLYTTPTLYNSTYKDSTTLTYAKYLDSSYHYLDIKAGMNLISLPNTSDLNATQLRSTFGSDITTIWTFRDGVWSGFSTMNEKIDTLSEQNLPLISSISHGEGVIVNSLIDKTLLFPKGEDYSIKDLNILENLSSGWHLVGTNKSISLAEIKLLNPNIISLWSYDTTKWFADASEEEFINNINAREITPLVNVESNSAFWAYVK